MDKISLLNKSLEKNRLEPITSLTESVMVNTYPYTVLTDLLEEAIVSFSNEQMWEWTREQLKLPFATGQKEWDLDTLGVHYNRIERLYYFKDGNVYVLNRLGRTEYKRHYLARETSGYPDYFTVENSTLMINKIPPEDIGLTIQHYKHIDPLYLDTDDIQMIPEVYQEPIVTYISKVLGYLLEKENAQLLDLEEKMSLSHVKKQNQQFYNIRKHKPAKLRW